MDPLGSSAAEFDLAPTTCPHGNPITGSAYRSEATITLAELEPGEVGRVRRVTEQLEVERGMSLGLERAGLVPGTNVRVESVSPDGSIAVKTSKGVIALAASTARWILVAPGDLGEISDRVNARRIVPGA